MKKQDKNKDFLLDNEFIAWRLFRTEEQNLHWARFADEHPECRGALDKAIHKFSAIKLNHFQLAESVQEELYHKILAEVYRRRTRRKRMVYWSAAAGMAVMLASSLFFLQPRDRQLAQQKVPDAETIIGQSMPSNDIRLIAGEWMTELKQNARIALTEDYISVEEKKISKIHLAENVMNKLIVPLGKRSTLQLADGTKMWLNSGTELDFPSKFEGDMREITVKGEIYIEVAKGEKPFYVNTPQFRIEVYGTTFNVSAYGENEENNVVLVEGSVEVTAAGCDPVKLTPREKAVVSADGIVKKSVNVEEYTGWKDGILIFNQTPISEVLKKVGRHCSIRFEDHSNKKLSTKTCTGKLYLPEDYEEIMISLSALSATQYHRDGDIIYLKNQ